MDRLKSLKKMYSEKVANYPLGNLEEVEIAYEIGKFGGDAEKVVRLER